MDAETSHEPTIMILENPYRIKRNKMNVIRYGGIVIVTAGLLVLILSLIPEHFPGMKEERWLSFSLSSTGFYLYIIGHTNLKLEKCFISFWDETIRYRLMKDKTEKTIRLEDIRSVVVETLRIRVQLTGSSEMIYLGNLKYREMKAIKDKFEEISLNIRKDI